MQKWEYKRLVGYFLTESELNEFGNEGWELIAVTYSDNSGMSHYYFKRPRD